MLIYQDTNNNHRFVAASYIGIVQQMREAAWQAPGKLHYMQEVAERIKTIDGGQSAISLESPEAFVRSLERYGWLYRVS